MVYVLAEIFIKQENINSHPWRASNTNVSDSDLPFLSEEFGFNLSDNIEVVEIFRIEYISFVTIKIKSSESREIYDILMKTINPDNEDLTYSKFCEESSYYDTIILSNESRIKGRLISPLNYSNEDNISKPPIIYIYNIDDIYYIQICKSRLNNLEKFKKILY